jgi:hypothetical protein
MKSFKPAALLIGYQEQKCLQPRANEPRLMQYGESFADAKFLATRRLLVAHVCASFQINQCRR